jgi:hypothetical protein
MTTKGIFLINSYTLMLNNLVGNFERMKNTLLSPGCLLFKRAISMAIASFRSMNVWM